MSSGNVTVPLSDPWATGETASSKPPNQPAVRSKLGAPCCTPPRSASSSTMRAAAAAVLAVSLPLLVHA
ncbi:hypothetical protein CHLRE_01g022666v5 [Chlamydomonas reinhardtii]|uniref:Uncharacterized protein n=1 Tax=Chlamydomonas reinhardtii TaxID=3055 RepID=A0A2K3E655_CHLRE|nr:uncharacterized protein CHLRE_01g022666v5 [Chlamydomonas reinhardtii]PNW88285.1 hypothetical protein CHLRE_01g022666v5 [Chlamydomonas reinhardtii]